MAVNKWECNLTDINIKRAQKELNENPQQRLVAVEIFRKWIEDQKHIKCITDTYFLLRFLRAAKFSQLRARELLEKYLTNLEAYPKWLRYIDGKEKGIQNYFKTGAGIPLPGFDKNGAKVLIIDCGKTDTTEKLHNLADMMRSIMFSFLQMLYDENIQVGGFVTLLDYGNFGYKHFAYYNLDFAIKYCKIVLNSFPARFKGLHIYRGGPIFDTILQAAKPFLRKKLQDRIILHGNNLESVYKYIPQEMLPVEYLPDDYKGPNAGHLADLLEAYMKEISNESLHRRVLYETGPSMGINKKDKDKDAPRESFMKLNTD